MDDSPKGPKIAGLHSALILTDRFGSTAMNGVLMKINLLISVFAAFALAGNAQAAPRPVDCDKGQSIQKALDSAPAAGGERYELFVTGDCHERVVIRRDDVTIRGDATIFGDIRVFQASDVWIYGVTVTAPFNGITVAGSNHVRLTGVHLVGNEGVGLMASSRAQVWLRSGAVIADNAANGVYLEDSSLRVDDASITGNLFSGIEAFMSTVVLQRSATISGNTLHGIDANLHSSVLLRDEASIHGNYEIGIQLVMDSGLFTMDESRIYDNLGANVYCPHIESSAEFLGHMPDNVGCTDFNQMPY